MSQNYSKLLEKQRNFFKTGKTKDVEFRIQALKKLKKVIISRNDEINEALKKDLNKSEFETFTSEIAGPLNEINFALKNLYSWTKPLKVKTPLILFRGKSRVYYEPFGTVLIITPWNYPFNLVMSILTGAVAAGNCCVVKPSELSPYTSGLVSEIIREVFDEEHCASVDGGVSETTELLKERFDFIHYTGSTNVGKVIARAAAEYLTPITLELGGKSPCIVDKSADLEVSARRILWGKFLNAGQTCVAPDYLLIHKDIKNQFLDIMKKELLKFYGENPEESNDYVRIINEKHFDRIASLLSCGNIITGGRTNREQLYIEPAVIDGITWENPVMRDEIFGPVLPVLEYENIDEIIEMITSREKPLALYLFSKNKSIWERIIKEVSFGGGCINDVIFHQVSYYLPFGGVGNSGMGAYHGKWGFEAFSHKKGILNKSLWPEIKLFYPPYNEKIKFVKKFLK